ncbi:MAG: phospho-N-acetylmuramoyl-pentapeptide-transferase [Ruminococcaceae bacterium]|nr:phospho-N-acetylmuramoyl-pentapeptide-transferase [Oscillospiraceae bacterium]
MTDILLTLLSALVPFVLTVLILKKLIPVLKSKKMGQPILEIGPRWHKSKEGTPTMGGLSFIIAIVISCIAASVYLGIKSGFETVVPLILTVAYGVICAMIGFIDDLAKLRKKQNEGLSAKQKFALQIAAAALYLAGLHFFCHISTALYIPFIGVELELKFAYYVIGLFLLVGIDNSVNLTDGIDGLASSVTFAVSVFFVLAAYLGGEAQNIPLAVLGALTAGGVLGFLVYNFYPARVFMGDTGSLFLGAVVAGAAFMLGNPLIVVIVGLIYIIETASVMLQVGYFKLTHGKRLFKMAPIHHHFEKSGFSEIGIVALFTGITVLCCAIAWFGLK